MDRNPAAYILVSKYQGVLHTGDTSNLPQRIWQNQQRLVGGFCRQYNVHRLVWFETHTDIYDAIVREKQIKKWKRDWKIGLTESRNPAWADLYDGILK